ncbi:cytochrome b [Crenobacter cavernae]|uniref:Cytochrome b n=1 Tax=Crenobacter cavernae TaxID=2290923 RepID=A0A345Y601_9NEIS|nr:cytochrome b [Crenobacter cavernae]AXK39353.1 cytochrome b [Crenobacter cavernae]
MTASSARHPAPTIVLHWLMALLIISAFFLGLTVADMPLSPTKFKWIGWHKWLGVTVLGLLALRLLLRALLSAPALPESMSSHTKALAKLGHAALYALMLAVPLTGWLMSSAYGFPVVYLKLVALPDLVAKNKELGDALREVHVLLNWILAAAVAGHVLAALKHQLVDRDGLLARMSLRRS